MIMIKKNAMNLKLVREGFARTIISKHPFHVLPIVIPRKLGVDGDDGL